MTTVTETPTPATETADGQSAPELGAVLDEAVRKAVAAQVAAEAKDIAKGVVAAMLTPDVIAAMQATAEAEAVAALAPAEPEPEEAPRLLYANLDVFVNEYVVQIYRREVTARGSENTRRWCPMWWIHGEAYARLDAVWSAFEHLRHGETLEYSQFFLEHFDPHMAVLFDTEGPFKYCSPAEGHRSTYVNLPVLPAVDGVCPDGHYEQRPSGLLTPSAPTGNRRVVMEFPG